MIGHQDRWQEELFVAGSLRSLIPEDHILKRVDRVLDLSWLKEDVRDLYCESNGRPSIDPEAAVRLMLAGFFQGIVHDRKLMREAQVNIAIRWFAGYKLDEKLPHHSSLTYIRQRWGENRFKKIFERTVKSCIEAGLVNGDTVHVDGTLIRADVSWESLSAEYADNVIEENKEKDNENKPTKPGKTRGGGSSSKRKAKKRSKTDPDATMATSSRNFHLQPTYKQHTAVDSKAGVVVDVKLTTGENNEGKELLEQLDRVEEATVKRIGTVPADAGYAHSNNYAQLERRGTKGLIPPQKENIKAKHFPLRLFKYDSKHNVVRCPRKKKLTKRGRSKISNGWWYRSSTKDCKNCPLRAKCIQETMRTRSVVIVDGYDSLLRARRAHASWDIKKKKEYERHRWLVEGRHGEAKTQHGLRRAVRRGLDNVSIQVYLTAAVMNLKRLAAVFLCYPSNLSFYRSLFRAILSQVGSVFQIRQYATELEN